MVTDSKAASKSPNDTGRSVRISLPDGEQEPLRAASPWKGEEHGELGNEGDDETQGPEDGGGSSNATSEPTHLRLSYGERLVLETCNRMRGRQYDRAWQEELAQPKRRGSAASSQGVEARHLPHAGKYGGSTQDSGEACGRPESSRGCGLPADQVESMVNRLSQPRRQRAMPRNTAELLLVRSRDAAHLKREGFDVDAMIRRLASPRVPSMTATTPGERMVMMHNRATQSRSVDTKRIEELSRATRRAGSAAAWGVRAEDVRPATTVGALSSARGKGHAPGQQEVWSCCGSGPADGKGLSSEEAALLGLRTGGGGGQEAGSPATARGYNWRDAVDRYG